MNIYMNISSRTCLVKLHFVIVSVLAGLLGYLYLLMYSPWSYSLLTYSVLISGTIYEGTSNIQLSTIAKSLAQEYWKFKNFVTDNRNNFTEY